MLAQLKGESNINRHDTHKTLVMFVLIIIILKRAVSATALVVRKTKTLSEAFSRVDPQRRLLHPDHYLGDDDDHHHDLHCHQCHLVEILKFGWNSEIWSKFKNLVGIQKYLWNYEISLKLLNLVKILIFGKISEIWSKFWNLVKIPKFGWNSEM